MKKNISSTIFILLLMTLFACNSTTDKAGDFYTDVGKWKAPQVLLEGDKKKHVARPSTQLIDNELAVLYSAEEKIMLNYKGKEIVVDPDTSSTKVWLFTDAKKHNIYAFWWKKEKEGKRLYFRGSTDQGKNFSKKVVINTGGGVLQQIQFYSPGDGRLILVYQDERRPPYQIYFNTSTDNGISWRKEDIRLDNDENSAKNVISKDKQVPISFALNPLVAYLDSGKLLTVWQQRKVVGNEVRSQIVGRVTSDMGKTWEPEHTIFTWDDNRIVESAIAYKGNKVIVVAGYPKKGLLGFYATDNMASKQLNWTALGAVAGTQDANEISWLRTAMSDTKFKIGFIFKKEQKDKYQINLASMDLDKGQWDKKLFRIDRNKKQPVKTIASYFDLKTLPNGEFVIAWQDYRSLIPMLMLDYTNNKGQQWQADSIELTRPGLSYVKYPEILLGKDKVWVNFEWDIIKDDKLPRLVNLKFDMDSKTGQLQVHARPEGKKYSKDKLIAKLKKRAETFMDHRVKKEWEKTWYYMDPVFQLATDKTSWLKNMGYVTFEDYEIKTLEVDGRFGTVQIDMKVSLPQQVRRGELMEATAPKVSTTTTKWLWFHDDWYFYPSGSFFQHLKY